MSMAFYCVIGCGYVGTTAATHFKYQGHHITGTTKSRDKLLALSEVVHDPLIVDIANAATEFDFLEHQDGLLISVAPSREGESFEDVFGTGITRLVEALKHRRSTHPLHVTYISTAGVYGDQDGKAVCETSPLDLRHPLNALLSAAEDALQSIDRDDTSICILRIGGIYGPGRDMAHAIKAAAGEQIKKNGDHICAWTNIVDIAEGLSFAYTNQLQGIFNLVDDMQLTRRQLSNQICDIDGLPPVLWMNNDRPGQRITHAKVSNSKIKSAGYDLKSPSMLASLHV
ncbi:MAG: NAD-dependent epimerase/dehydratase family protein [Synechococcus sp.]